MEHKTIFSEVDEIVGKEGFNEIFSTVSQASLKGAKFATGKVMDGFSVAFDKATRELIKSLGSYKMKLSQAEKQAKKHHPSLFFSNDVLKQISTNGGSDTLIKDAKTLTEELKVIKNFILDIQAFNEKHLSLLKQYTKIKNISDATKVLEGLESLTFPTPKFQHKNNVMLETNVMPSNKIFKFNTQTSAFTIGSHEFNDSSSDNALSSDDVETLLKEVGKLEIIYQTVISANKEYITYLKKFNIVIKESFEYLEKSDMEISSSVRRDLLSHLEGDKSTFGFYTGFLPKVINYVDGYINTLTAYLISKTS